MEVASRVFGTITEINDATEVTRAHARTVALGVSIAGDLAAASRRSKVTSFGRELRRLTTEHDFALFRNKQDIKPVVEAADC